MSKPKKKLKSQLSPKMRHKRALYAKNNDKKEVKNTVFVDIKNLFRKESK